MQLNEQTEIKQTRVDPTGTIKEHETLAEGDETTRNKKKNKKNKKNKSQQQEAPGESK